MDKRDLRIVFMGNPEFARYQLEHLLNVGFHIVGVISAPDKAAGRGMKLHSTPVTTYAREQGIPTLQPANLKSPEFLGQLKALRPDIQVVIAFRMLPESVWSLPPMGTVNLHASLLPDYRGAAPINWAIMNGETRTGLTTFKLKHQIDTGDIFLQQSCAIEPDDTAGSLHDRLMVLGATLMERTLNGLLKGDLRETPQVQSGEHREAPKLFAEHCEIHWDRPGKRIHDQIRGLSPYPVAFTQLKGKRLKIFQARFEPGTPIGSPGTLQTDGRSVLGFSCADGIILLEEVQLEGKRRMSAAEFLRGFDPR